MDLNKNRQYISIWNAVDAKNFKHAVKIIDKRLSKGPDDYLEALKFYIHGKSSHISDKLKILIHLEELSNREAFISNSDAIDIYEEVLDQAVPRSTETWAKTIGELRWKCVKLSSKDEKLCLSTFETCLFNNDLDHARQIANVMEKNFTKNRNYIFWNLTTMFLFSLSENYPDDEKLLWRNLAVAQIIKDQRATQSKCIQTPQEILLLHKLLKSSGKIQQSGEYLKHPLLGPESPAAKGEWELWRMRLKHLSQSRNWLELFELSIALLRRARMKSSSGQQTEVRFCDWIVWESVIHSAFELNNFTCISKIRAELEAHLAPDSGIEKTYKRNASLAFVKFHFDSSVPFSKKAQKNSTDPLSTELISLLKYLFDYGGMSTAYGDIRPFVEALEASERTKLLSILTGNIDFMELIENKELMTIVERLSSTDLSSPERAIRAVNNFKLKYLLNCSILEKNHENLNSPLKNCSSQLTELSRETMNLYKFGINNSDKIAKNLLVTDRHPIDDAAVLSSMCLIKIGLKDEKHQNDVLKSKKVSYILQAALLLEFAWIYSKHNFQISLLLLRLYSYLGCGSLAMRTYQRLGLRQVQLDTLSYTFFDRISTFHPHPFDHLPDGVANNLSPADHLKRQQRFYAGVAAHTTANVWLSFKHGSYNSILEIKDASDRLQRSISAISCDLESRRISRLLKPETSLGSLPKKYDDIYNNDYCTFPSFESIHSKTFLEICSFLPHPTIDRVRGLALHEQILNVISTHHKYTHNEEASLFKWLYSYSLIHFDSNKLEKNVMTNAETLAYNTYHSLAIILHLSCNSKCWSEEDYEQHLKSENSILLSILEDQQKLVRDLTLIVPALQETLHNMYTLYQVGKTIFDFCEYITSRGKSVYQFQQEINEKIKPIAGYLVNEVIQKSIIIKTHLNDCGWIDRVLDRIDDELKAIVDESFMEQWAVLVIESWRDSVVGFTFLQPLRQ